MQSDRKANISIETCDHFSVAFAFDWPGACGWGPTLDAAVARLKPDIEYMAKWLVQRGFECPAVPDLSGISVAEHLPATGDPAVDCDSEGFYTWDAQPYTDAELARTAMMIGVSRAALMSVVDGLSNAALDLRLVEGKRTIREILDHIAIAEWWYTTRVSTGSATVKGWRDYGTDAHSRLIEVRDMYLRDHLPRLAEAGESERVRQYVRGRETWSGRKTLRRAFWHEMLHYRQLTRLVPKVLAHR